MSGLDKTTPIPTEIKLHQVSRKLEIAFDNGTRFELPYEFLRVYSPSAEVRGHGPGQEILQVGKKNIEIKGIEPVGSYAVTLTFSDGHDTGIYSWDYLLRAGRELRRAMGSLSEPDGSGRRFARTSGRRAGTPESQVTMRQ